MSQSMKKKCCNCFLARVLSIPKKLVHIVRNKIKKKNHDNWLKNKKVIQSQKRPKTLKK